jgi:hypothetical protein
MSWLGPLDPTRCAVFQIVAASGSPCRLIEGRHTAERRLVVNIRLAAVVLALTIDFTKAYRWQATHRAARQFVRAKRGLVVAVIGF